MQSMEHGTRLNVASSYFSRGVTSNVSVLVDCENNTFLIKKNDDNVLKNQFAQHDQIVGTVSLLLD
jgi:hypothetical protein